MFELRGYALRTVSCNARTDARAPAICEIDGVIVLSEGW
jgi:hypothetical protein